MELIQATSLRSRTSPCCKTARGCWLWFYFSMGEREKRGQSVLVGLIRILAKVFIIKALMVDIFYSILYHTIQAEMQPSLSR